MKYTPSWTIAGGLVLGIVFSIFFVEPSMNFPARLSIGVSWGIAFSLMVLARADMQSIHGWIFAFFSAFLTFIGFGLLALFGSSGSFEVVLIGILFAVSVFVYSTR
jgi:hypothetical protein